VFCANASDGILTAHPYLKGEHLQDIKGKKGYPLGQEIMHHGSDAERGLSVDASSVRSSHAQAAPVSIAEDASGYA
jgi:hypothetical protein